MKCECGGLLRVTNTYPGGGAARASSATCGLCMRRATIVSFVAYCATGKGQGAAAVGRALAAGEVMPMLRLRPKVAAEGGVQDAGT